MRGTTAAIAAALALGAGCIEKPDPPGAGDRDGGGGDGDGGAIDGDAGPCPTVDLIDPQPWLDTDEIRFDRDQGRVNGDCLDDLAIPGSRAAEGPGVFVVLGRDDMLTAGFDFFVDTEDRVAADVRLTQIVGDDELDLIVLANTGAADDSATILIFEGDGQGGFALATENTTNGVQLSIGAPNFPQPLFLNPIQLVQEGEVSLQYGDADTLLTLSPADWEDIGGETAQPLTGVAISVSGLTDVFQVESGSPGVEDFVLLDSEQLDWYAWFDPDEFTQTELDVATPGIGRAAFADIDQSGDADIVYSRAQGVFANLLTAPIGANQPGDDVELQFEPEPNFDPSIQSFADLGLASLDGMSSDDLLLVAVDDATGDTSLLVYPDLVNEGGGVLANGAAFVKRDVGGDAASPRNRVVAGHFSDEDAIDVLLFSSKPQAARAICLRAVVDGDVSTLTLCPPSG